MRSLSFDKHNTHLDAPSMTRRAFLVFVLRHAVRARETRVP